MTSFTSVRYGSKFPSFRSDTLDSAYNRGKSPYVNSPGQGPFSLASLMGNTDPTAAKPSIPTSVTPATAPTPSDTARTTVQSGAKFTPPDAGALSTDPILMQIRDLGQRNVQDASSGALGGAEAALVGYGSVDVPESLKQLYAQDTSNPIYGALADENTRAAAAANPDSTLRQLALEHDRLNSSIDQATNANNTYYGSAHANQLSDEAGGYRQRQNSAAQSLAALLGQANQGVLDARQHSQDQYLAELPAAYQRALDLASLLGGGDPNAGGTPPPPDGGNRPNVFVPSLAPDSIVGNSAYGGQFQTLNPASGLNPDDLRALLGRRTGRAIAA